MAPNRKASIYAVFVFKIEKNNVMYSNREEVKLCLKKLLSLI